MKISILRPPTMSRSSPRASLNSPSASSSAHGPSASPSTKSRSSNAPTATPRGPVPLALETSYHKRLRSLLLEHRKLRKEWNELVLRGILGRCKSVVEAWIEVEYVPPAPCASVRATEDPAHCVVGMA